MVALGGEHFEISVLVLVICLWIVPLQAGLFIVFVLNHASKSTDRPPLGTAILPAPPEGTQMATGKTETPAEKTRT